MIIGALNIARKEWKDGLRDRRSFLSAVVYSAIGPIAIFAILNGLAAEVNNETATRLAVLGTGHAPVLVNLIENRDLQVFEIQDQEPIDALAEYDAVLAISESFADKLGKVQQAELELFVDRTKDAGMKSIERVRRAMGAVQSRYVSTRLISRGVNPEIINAIDLKVRSVEEKSVETWAISRLLVLFFVMAPFFASLSIAADMTAGERERDALQPLLMQPVSRWSIVLGKWIVATGIGLLGVTATILAASFAVNASPTTEIGILLYASAGAQWDMMIILAPFVGLVVALQMLIALIAKSYKEAQTYLSLLLFLPIVVAFAAVFKKEYTPDVGYAPMVHQLGLLQRALLDQPLDPALTAMGAGLTLAATGFCLFACVKTYQSERMLRG